MVVVVVVLLLLLLLVLLALPTLLLILQRILVLLLLPPLLQQLTTTLTATADTRSTHYCHFITAAELGRLAQCCNLEFKPMGVMLHLRDAGEWEASADTRSYSMF